MNKFDVNEYNVKNLSNSHLSRIIKILKNLEENLEIIKIFRFLHVFLTSGEGAGNRLLENRIIPIISEIISHNSDKNVIAEALSVLTITVLKSGKWKQNMVADCGILALTNILNDADLQTCGEAIETILQQFQTNPSSAQSLVNSTALVLKLTDLINSREVSEGVKGKILPLVIRIVDANTSVEEMDVQDQSDRSASSCSASSSSCTSASTSSSPLLTIFPRAIKRLAVSVAALKFDDVVSAVLKDATVRYMIEKYGDKICYDESVSCVPLPLPVPVPVPVAFEADASALSVTLKNLCRFKVGGSQWHTVFVDSVIERGIYTIDVKILKFSGDHTVIGVCPQSQKQILTLVGHVTEQKSGGINFHNYENGSFDRECVYLYAKGQNWSPNLFSSFPFDVESVISVEVDTSARTAHFFVNGSLLPYFLSNIPDDDTLAFAISSRVNGEFELTSLRKLGKPSVPSSDASLTAVSLL